MTTRAANGSDWPPRLTPPPSPPSTTRGSPTASRHSRPSPARPISLPSRSAKGRPVSHRGGGARRPDRGMGERRCLSEPARLRGCGRAFGLRGAGRPRDRGGARWPWRRSASVYAERGFWKIVSRIFPENTASLVCPRTVRVPGRRRVPPSRQARRAMARLRDRGAAARRIPPGDDAAGPAAQLQASHEWWPRRSWTRQRQRRRRRPGMGPVDDGGVRWIRLLRRPAAASSTVMTKTAMPATPNTPAM